MIVQKTGKGTEESPLKADLPEGTSYKKIRDIDETTMEVEILYSKEEKLRQEFDQKLEQRVNQIAEAVESGARGQELADKMRKK